MPLYHHLLVLGLLLPPLLVARVPQAPALPAAGIFEHTAEAMPTHIHKGRNAYSSEILYTWDGEHLYTGRNAYSSAILYTWDGKHLYKGRNTYSSEILYTWDGKHLYKGRNTYSSEILYT